MAVAARNRMRLIGLFLLAVVVTPLDGWSATNVEQASLQPGPSIGAGCL